jgi:predicted ArsR family transcriptional regulator
MSKSDKPLERQLEPLAALADPARRALYLYVVDQAGEVSRDQAARAVRVSRALAAFHLDKLAEAGLLDVSFRRLSGRTGPGAGRPSKLYRRSALQVDLTLPARRYELAARLLARATAESGPAGAEALERAATAWGVEIGRKARERAGKDAGDTRIMRAALTALHDAGFAPRREARGDIVLGNCPFDALRSEARTLICGMNLALCRGLVAGMEAPGWKVRFEPGPERCCAVFEAP